MYSVLKYDEVVLIKEFEKLKQVGEIYEVANITENSMILRTKDTKIAVGVIGINDFYVHFRKFKEVTGWTNWIPIVDDFGSLICYYRTNFKKVQVQLHEKYKAEASCHALDEFNVSFGIKLAYQRCRIKHLNDLKNTYENSLKKTESELMQCKHNIKKMINSLEEKTKDVE